MRELEIDTLILGFLIGLLVGGGIAIFFFLSDFTGTLHNNGLMHEKDCLLLKNSINTPVNEISAFQWGGINWTSPNYSETPYHQVQTKDKFIYFGCVNSTLVIKNNQISCEVLK